MLTESTLAIAIITIIIKGKLNVYTANSSNMFFELLVTNKFFPTLPQPTLPQLYHSSTTTLFHSYTLDPEITRTFPPPNLKFKYPIPWLRPPVLPGFTFTCAPYICFPSSKPLNAKLLFHMSVSPSYLCLVSYLLILSLSITFLPTTSISMPLFPSIQDWQSSNLGWLKLSALSWQRCWELLRRIIQL